MIDWILITACAYILLALLCFGVFCFDMRRDLRAYRAQEEAQDRD
jgi:hypothetical protein